MQYVLRNDEILPRDLVHIDIEDRGYQFGDGVYEVIRFYDGKLFHIEEHLNRLLGSLSSIEIALPLPVDVMLSKLQELVETADYKEGKIYLQVTRGVHPRIHSFPEGVPPLLIAYCSEAKRNFEQLDNGIHAIAVPDDRWLRVNIKSLNLLPNTIAKQKAAERGAVEAIFVRNGIVTECSASNIYGVKDGSIYTHPSNHLILNGITRQVTKKLAKQANIPWIEAEFTLEDLQAMDEVFASNTIIEICPVLSVANVPIKDGKPGTVTRELQKLFSDKIARFREQ
ncbi:D-amino-acid transaminase [Paenibacillus septentrionalis]|uniref:D-alanine aminotransferase n=1 Tax=Paenibacillus septentrionalis TaxID=429342 RepID=A0ABW1V1H7_9BACL